MLVSLKVLCSQCRLLRRAGGSVRPTATLRDLYFFFFFLTNILNQDRTWRNSAITLARKLYEHLEVLKQLYLSWKRMKNALRPNGWLFLACFRMNTEAAGRVLTGTFKWHLYILFFVRWRCLSVLLYQDLWASHKAKKKLHYHYVTHAFSFLSVVEMLRLCDTWM